MLDHFRPGQVVYSYGISTEISFDYALAQRGLKIMMYDHTIDRLPYTHLNFEFIRQGVSSTATPDGQLSDISSHLAKNGHFRNDLILKMDVEGAEWSVFDSIDEELLRNFEQIVFEVHGLTDMQDTSRRALYHRVFSKLNRHFSLVHVHANNWAEVRLALGFAVFDIMELSYVRNDLVEFGPWDQTIPTRLDAPNILGKHDYVLSCYPFLPGGLRQNELVRLLTESEERSQQHEWEIHEVIDIRGTDIAGSGLCSQSSLSAWSTVAEEAHLATRGKVSGGFAFHTSFEESPWWKLDFGHSRQFDEIICFNRLGGCSDRARYIVVEASDDGVSWQVLWANQEDFGGADGRPLIVQCSGAKARWVRLRLPQHNALHLDAVAIIDWAEG